MMSQNRSTYGRENFAQPHLVFTKEDILTEILIRLPILCIHLFTTVSKQWLQILTSPYFTDRCREIPIIDPPAGIFANHVRSLFESNFVSLDPRLESRKSAMDNSFTIGSNKETYHVNILQSCNGLLLYSGWGSPAFYYIYNPSSNLFKRLPQPENSHDVSILHAIGVLRMAFDPIKSRNWNLCKDRVSYYNFCHFATSIYWNDAFHWLETKDRQLSLYKFHIDDHEHTIITTSENPNGLHHGSNFLQSFGGREGSHDLMFIQIDIPAILHQQRRLFESRGCLHLVSRDDIDSIEFTIYEMVKGCHVWTVRYVVNTDEFMTLLPDRWSIWSTVWSIDFAERVEDSFLVINISRKVVKYNIISKIINQIFDIGSNEMDDEYWYERIFKSRTKKKAKTKQNQARNGKDKVKGQPSEENTT
ncbi:receptor-like serine/threonine-protein kinase SD1-8 [Tanacetum coccineum]